MPDSIGRISVPEVAASGTFPLVSDYPHRREVRKPMAAHRFGSGEAKIEQRFLLGPAVTRYWFQREWSEPNDTELLREFWEARQGPYQPFAYNAPGDAHGDATTPVTCRFDSSVLELEHVTTRVRTGFYLEELPPSAPAYTVTKTLERFPDAGFASALLQQEHEIIPLVRIRVSEAAVPDITISDRRCTVGGTLYQARLLSFGGINQSIGGQADDAVFELGNADGVMRLCAADTNLRRAVVELKLYHVGTQTLVNLWAGRVLADGGWEGETSARFVLRCSDPIQALNLPYPRRTISRRCWKRFNDGLQCPFATQGSLNGSYPSASASECDKGWETPNGCRAHNMDNYHGGIQQDPARALIKLSNTGIAAGLGRRRETVASIVAESAFHGLPVPEVWTNLSTAVPGIIVAGRDEDEFYDALAIVSEGPIGAFGTGHRLDGQAHHGPGSLGLRTSLGPNPNTAPFSITNTGGPTPAERAAGTAFLELRRTDQEGLQLTQAEEHQLTAVVSQGLAGWKWTSGSRSSVAGAANPIWVAVNAWLRHQRIEGASAAVQEATFDVDAAETAAGYCDASVAKIVGSGSTTQFVFRGVIGEQRPFRDWLTEILANCLGDFTFKFGKLRLSTRTDSVSVESFTAGNMLFESLRVTAWPVEATRFVAYFGERRTDSGGVPVAQAENVTAEDEDAAIELGGASEPIYAEASRNFVGTDTRDQAARLATTRLREMVGGVTAVERAQARRIQFETTVLALGCEPGQVIRVTHGEVPGGDQEYRVETWEMLPDWRVVITARPSTNSMYDLTVGSTAADVEPDALPDESTPELEAQPVTNFDAQEDPAGSVDPKTGQTQSLVTVSYDEPSPTGAFAGVAIWAQHYDGTDELSPGSPTAEPWLVTKIPVNATPEARVLPPFETTQKVLRLGAVEYSDIKEGRLDWGTTPNDYVLLDGKNSAPTEPANEWCQQVDGGLDLSAEQNPEPDIDEYRIAFTGDKTPYSLDPADGAIKDAQVIGTVKARNVTGERWHFLYVERIYTGQADATQTWIDLEGTSPQEWKTDQWLVETADGVFEGANVQVLGEDDGVVANLEVVSNTAGRLTFATGTLPAAGRTRFRFRGAAGEMRFYCAAVDVSGNVSLWGAFPDCEPFARDGTTDRSAPTTFSPAPGTFLSYFTAGFTGLTSIISSEAARQAAGVVGVQVMAVSEDEAESDANLAKMYSIRGVHTVEVELTFSEDGTTNLQTEVWRFPWKAENLSYGGGYPPLAAKWHVVSKHTIPLPGMAVASGRARVANAWGFGAWSDLYAEYVRGGGGPVYTGQPAQKLALLAASATSGSIAVRPDTGAHNVIGPLTGAVTIALPSPAPEVNEEVLYEIRQPRTGAEGYQVTFAANFKDVPADIPRVVGTKIVARFKAESASSLRCTGFVTLPYEG